MWYIYKYEMPVLGEEREIELPENLHICDFHAQGDRVYMWACVDLTSKLVTRKFMVIGTGWEIDNPHRLQFLKTVHMQSGEVWHVLAVHHDADDKSELNVANSAATPELTEEACDVS